MKEDNTKDLQSILNFDDPKDFFNEELKIQPTEVKSTEVLNNKEEIESYLSIDEINEMFEYLKGSSRPEFMDKMVTQTGTKLVELIKVMTILYLNRIPLLLEYQKSIQENLLNTESIKNMSFEEMSKVSSNIQKEINDLLSFALNVSTKLGDQNVVPTKVEKIASLLLSVPDSLRNKIEEMIALDLGDKNEWEIYINVKWQNKTTT